MLEWIKVGENLALEHNRGRTGWQIQRFHIYSSWFLFRKNWILGAFVFLILYIWALLRRMYDVTPNWLQFEVTKKVALLFRLIFLVYQIVIEIYHFLTQFAISLSNVCCHTRLKSERKLNCSFIPVLIFLMLQTMFVTDNICLFNTSCQLFVLCMM